MPRFRDRSEFGPTLDAAAERLGISATAVEKGLLGERGLGTTDKLMKQMASVAATGVGGEMSPVGGSEKGRHRSYAISYPATRNSTALVRTSVLLEMGIRGGEHPRDTVMIGCLLGDTLAATGTDLSEFEDLEPFEIVVLQPGRTLFDKLALIHRDACELGADANLQPNSRIGRHFYDVYQLLGNDRVRAFLVQHAEVEEVIDDIAAITRKCFSSGEVIELRPDGGFAASPAFDPASDASARLPDTYGATMSELYFGADPLPSWDEICVRVADMRELL